MKKWRKKLIWWLGTIWLTLLGLCVTPFLFVWLLIDAQRLRRTATEIEPLPDLPPVENHGVFMRLLVLFLDRVVQPLVILIGLPIIVIIGMFAAIIDRDNPEDDFN